MIPAENLVPGHKFVPSPTNESSITQIHGGGAKTAGAADAAHKAVRKITCLGSGFVGGELAQLPCELQLTANQFCFMG